MVWCKFQAILLVLSIYIVFASAQFFDGLAEDVIEDAVEDVAERVLDRNRDRYYSDRYRHGYDGYGYNGYGGEFLGKFKEKNRIVSTS